MENKKGCPIPCSQCPKRLDNLSDEARKDVRLNPGNVLFYFGLKDVALTFVANPAHCDGIVAEQLSSEEVNVEYPEFAESVGKCSGPRWETIGGRKKFLKFFSLPPDEVAFCPAYEDAVGSIANNNLSEADKVIKYFNREEAQG